MTSRTCSSCHQPGHFRKTCGDTDASRQDRWRRNKIAAGLCGWCGKRKLKATSTQRCSVCQQKHTDERRVSRREAAATVLGCSALLAVSMFLFGFWQYEPEEEPAKEIPFSSPVQSKPQLLYLVKDCPPEFAGCSGYRGPL